MKNVVCDWNERRNCFFFHWNKKLCDLHFINPEESLVADKASQSECACYLTHSWGLISVGISIKSLFELHYIASKLMENKTIAPWICSNLLKQTSNWITANDPRHRSAGAHVPKQRVHQQFLWFLFYIFLRQQSYR